MEKTIALQNSTLRERRFLFLISRCHASVAEDG
jgi:hypothetical protein